MTTHNMRIKVPAYGTPMHGKKRRRFHAAPYPQRYPDAGAWIWTAVIGA